MHRSWLRARRALVSCTAVAAGLLAGCGDPGGPSDQAFALQTVNHHLLPAAYPDPLVPEGTFVVTAGELVLKGDGTLHGSFTIACAPAQPEGSTCTVDEPRQSFTGTYSRNESWVKLSQRFYPAEFGGSSVRFRIYIPSYVGLYPEYDVLFTR